MRVIAGEARSLPLKAPAGTTTRPTTDRIKETLFNMLQNQLADSVFIDIFSGSGGIGIEAISRGARKAYFIESDRQALSCIRENLNFTKFSDRGEILEGDALTAIHGIKETADFIFLDPPYDSGLEIEVLTALLHKNFVDEDTLFIVESDINKDVSDYTNLGFVLNKEKKYKSNKHVFLYKKIEE